MKKEKNKNIKKQNKKQSLKVKSSVLRGSYKKFQREIPFLLNRTVLEAKTLMENVRTTRTSRDVIKHLLSKCSDRIDSTCKIKSIMTNVKKIIPSGIRYCAKGKFARQHATYLYLIANF